MGDDPGLLLAYKVEELTKDVIELKREVETARADAIAREHKRLVWGIGTLGTIVSTLVGVIWAYRSVIFK